MRPPATALITLLVSSVLATACAKDETCSAPGVLVSIGVDANVKIEDIVKIGIEASLDTSRRTGELSAGAVGLGSGDADRFALTFTNKEITSTHTLELTLSAFDRDGALVAIGRADPAITVRAGEACASAVVTLLPPTTVNPEHDR